MRVRKERSLSVGFVLAGVMVGMALLLIELTRPWLGSSVYLFFLGSVVVTAQFGGLWPGLLATFLSLVVADLVFFETPWQIIGDFKSIRTATIFTMVSILISAISDGRSKAEARERRLRRQYEETLNGIGEGVISTDLGGRVVSLNTEAERMTGWIKPAAFGKPLGQIFRAVEESTRVACPELVELVVRSGQPVTVAGSALLLSRGGREILIERDAAPIRDFRNVITGVALVFRDVTEKLRAERKLAESESRFRSFMDHSPFFAFIKDEDGHYVWGNVAWAGQHAHFQGDPIGRTDHELWPEETALKFRASDRAALDAGKTVQVIESTTNLDGHNSKKMTVKFPLQEDSGRRLVGGVAVEFSDQIKTEVALRESEQRYRLLFDSNPHPMWIFDVESLRFLAVNEAAVQHYGYSKDEFLSMTLADIRPEAEVPSLLQAVHERKRRPYATSGGWRHRKKDGSVIDVEITSTATEFEGRPARIILANDVTERVQAERELQVSGERLDLTLDAANLGVWFSDLPFKTLWWDARCRQHFGVLTDEPVTIETFKARLHPEDQEAVIRDLGAAIEGGTPVDLEFRTLEPGGKVRWIRSIGRVFRDHEGLADRFDAVTVDVSEAKRVEADLREAKESAEAANRSKDRFLAVLSHELRTPLTPVLATVTAMLDEPDDFQHDPDEIRQTLAMIRRSVELEARLIDDLLDVSRIVHGKLALDRSPVDVHNMIHQTLGICRSDLNGKRMRLELRLAARRTIVEADPARFQQVLWNLIKNAVKFTPDGGMVAIWTRDVEPVAEGDSPQIEVEVNDSGIGIEPEVLTRIFEAFEQGEGTITRRFGGLGLGLAISRSVIEAHGGQLSASSSGINQGSTFTIKMTARDGATAHNSGQSLRPPVEPRSLRILLVEDDNNTLRVLSRLLRQKGHEVSTADNVASAREVFAKTEFDLLVSDIGLPDGTGIDLMRHVQATRPTRGVALTGFGMDEDIRKCQEVGFVAHLIKPVDFQKLEATINQVTADVPG